MVIMHDQKFSHTTSSEFMIFIYRFEDSVSLKCSKYGRKNKFSIACCALSISRQKLLSVGPTKTIFFSIGQLCSTQHQSTIFGVSESGCINAWFFVEFSLILQPIRIHFIFHWMKSQTRRSVSSDIISPKKMLYYQLLQFFKNEKSVLNLVFKSFPQISFTALLSAFVGIINWSRLRSKVQKPRYFLNHLLKIGNNLVRPFIVEMQPVVFQKNELDYKEKPQKAAFIANFGLWGY